MSAARAPPAQGTTKKTYQQVNINNVFAPGRAPLAPQRSSGASFGSIVAGAKHAPQGLQSLGKANTIVKRRMPPPASLPSMRADGITDIDSANIVNDVEPTWSQPAAQEETNTTMSARTAMLPPWQQGANGRPGKTISSDFPTLGDVPSDVRAHRSNTDSSWTAAPPSTTTTQMTRADAQHLPSWQRPLMSNAPPMAPEESMETHMRGAGDRDLDRQEAPRSGTYMRSREEGVWSDDEAPPRQQPPPGYVAPPMVNGMVNTSVPPPNFYPQQPPPPVRYNQVRVGPITRLSEHMSDVHIDDSDGGDDDTTATDRDRRDNSDRDAAIARARRATQSKPVDGNWRQRQTSKTEGAVEHDEEAKAMPGTVRVMQRERHSSPPPLTESVDLDEDGGLTTLVSKGGKPMGRRADGAGRSSKSTRSSNVKAPASRDVRLRDDEAANATPPPPAVNVWAQRAAEQKASSVEPVERHHQQQQVHRQDVRGFAPTQHHDAMGTRKRHMETDARRQPVDRQQYDERAYADESHRATNGSRRGGARGGMVNGRPAPRGRSAQNRRNDETTFERKPPTSDVNGNEIDPMSARRNNNAQARGTGGKRLPRQPHVNGDGVETSAPSTNRQRQPRNQPLNAVDDRPPQQPIGTKRGEARGTRTQNARGARGGKTINSSQADWREEMVAAPRQQQRRQPRVKEGGADGARRMATSPPFSDGHEEWETASESSDVAQRQHRRRHVIAPVEEAPVDERPTSRNARGSRGGQKAKADGPKNGGERSVKQATRRAATDPIDETAPIRQQRAQRAPNSSQAARSTDKERAPNTMRSTDEQPSKNAHAASRQTSIVKRDAQSQAVVNASSRGNNPKGPNRANAPARDGSTEGGVSTTMTGGRSVHRSIADEIDINNIASVIVIDDMAIGQVSHNDGDDDEFEEVCSKKEKRARREAQAVADAVAAKKTAAEAVRAAKKAERAKALTVKRHEQKQRQQAAKAKKEVKKAPKIDDSGEDWKAPPLLNVEALTTTKPLLDAPSTTTSPEKKPLTLIGGTETTTTESTFDFTFDSQLATSQQTAEETSASLGKVSARVLVDSSSPMHAPIGTKPSPTTAAADDDDSLSARLQSVKAFWADSEDGTAEQTPSAAVVSTTAMFAASPTTAPTHPLVATVRPQQQQLPPPVVAPLVKHVDDTQFSMPPSPFVPQPQSPPQPFATFGQPPPMQQFGAMAGGQPQAQMSVWSNTYQTPMYGASQSAVSQSLSNNSYGSSYEMTSHGVVPHHVVNQPPPRHINFSQPPPPIFGAIGSQRAQPAFNQPPPAHMAHMQLGSLMGMPPPPSAAPTQQPSYMPPMSLPPPPVPIQRPRQVTRTPLTISAPSKTSPDASSKTTPSSNAAPPLDMLAEIDRLIHTQSAKSAPQSAIAENKA